LLYGRKGPVASVISRAGSGEPIPVRALGEPANIVNVAAARRLPRSPRSEPQTPVGIAIVTPTPWFTLVWVRAEPRRGRSTPWAGWWVNGLAMPLGESLGLAWIAHWKVAASTQNEPADSVRVWRGIRRAAVAREGPPGLNTNDQKG
jgi:hypothetical protein